MSSMMNSQGMALATAMAAVSGTVILLSFCIQKTIPIHQFSPPTLRSCFPSESSKKKKKQNNHKKRVHFAKDVVDPIGNGEDFRRQHEIAYNNNYSSSSPAQNPPTAAVDPRMPANRVALYNGIMRDRVVHRYTYSC
ncbi:hypothetical protein IC582_003937 [Cucumis melo]|uniref:Uncharacterized protein LOC103487448 n=2 Tax=Cucumis melo TaxID=3656 RepID=A0A1S3B9B6_CUCME|nr:uncharacterized protein LOC103487448 [Cucumis melo]KAA0050175.1 uncharacterized protein E6C27_scaffold675G002080 [Cucumis melo var. makuwa]TYK06428.1 uncharacterized protein E5676_scaffold163G001310 [Cucumis melo var. makuwa]